MDPLSGTDPAAPGRASSTMRWWFRPVGAGGLDGWVQAGAAAVMKDGRMDRKAMRAAQVGEDDILQSARGSPGLDSLHQIKHVVLEVSGGLGVIPKRQ